MNFVFRHNPIVHKTLVQFQIEETKYEFSTQEDTIISDFMEQIINVMENEKIITLEDIRFKNLDETFVSDSYYSFPISLILSSINEILISDLTFQVKIAIDRNSLDHQYIEESKMIILDEGNDCKLYFSNKCCTKKQNASITEKPYIVSMFGKAKVGKSRILSELLSDKLVFLQDKNLPQIGSENSSISKTKDVHLFERFLKIESQVKQVKFIDVESYDAEYVNQYEKIVNQRRKMNKELIPK
jgi:hypothetical protein